MTDFYNESKVALRTKTFSKNCFSSIHQSFLSHVGKTQKGGNILDIGTGNGYILNEIKKNYSDCYSLFGVDISKNMLSGGGSIGSHMNILLADNKNLPFKDACFSCVTAKNVTNFSVYELARILEDEGSFVFREYGLKKGLVEVADLFGNRLIRARDPSFYVDRLKAAGFNEIHIEEFRVAKEYTLEELTSIVQMFPFIENISNIDLKKIKNMFGDKERLDISSDPFLLIARRSYE